MRMQGMKTNTASGRIKNGIGQKMIQVNQHGSYHDQPGSLPLTAKKYPGNQTRKKEMKRIMKNCIQHFHKIQINRKKTGPEKLFPGRLNTINIQE